MAKYEPHDRFYRKAREKGLPSRAAFKIEELLRRVKLERGARVLDLGCAPGGWLAILGRAVGPEGRVVGVDIVSCREFAPPDVTIVADIRDEELGARLLEALGGKADLVTSDIAPKLTGIAERDEARVDELVEAALNAARRTLRRGGAMIVKVFMARGFKQSLARFEAMFEKVEVTRVSASRPGSSELYVIARDFRG